ncbi:MAG: NUDIX hydrolase [Prolixibacteraceae bacterium]|nr:NUDIX hydrolase [Prolixibacteraceae bacterium]
MILENTSVDCVIFGFDGKNLKVLLWQSELDLIKKFYRDHEDYLQVTELFEKNPFSQNENVWGLIGSHVPVDIDAANHAKYILSTFTSLGNVYLKQFKAFDKAKRVPFQRVVTIAYYALINPDYYEMKKMEVAKSLKWFNIDNLPEVIFDHAEIIEEALLKLREEVRYHPVGFHLLPEKFTLTQLQNLYETILGAKLDTRNFRKKILNMKLLVDTEEKQANVAHRAARLYAFNLDIYNKLVKEGLNFRI